MQEPDQDIESMLGLTAAYMENRKQLSVFVRARCRAGGRDLDVDDVMQDLWLRCRQIDASRIDDAKSYLFRMAHNLAIDRGRNVERGRHYEADWAYVKDRMDGSSEPAIAERRVIARDRLDRLDRALQTVGARPAWILHQFRVEGKAQRDIAAELGVSLSTVEKDLRRAYEALVTFREPGNED